MKQLLPLTCALMLLLCTGCGDSHDSLAAEGIATMKKMTTTLEGIKDEASASAKSDLKSLMAKFDSISERQAKLPTPTDAELKSMETKYGKQMEETAQKFQAQMMRIAMDPALRSQLDDIGESLKKGMK